jgi:hypothetical protein
VKNLGFSEEQVGYVASADLFGLAFGACRFSCLSSILLSDQWKDGLV